MEKVELQATVTKELSDELYNKLDGKEFAGEIDRLTKELNINWYLKLDPKSLIATRKFNLEKKLTHRDVADFHSEVCTFIECVKNLTHEESIPVLSDEQANEAIENYEFIKMLIDTWDETEEEAQTTGFAVLAGVKRAGFVIESPCARIPEQLAKELCMCYLKVHSHDK